MSFLPLDQIPSTHSEYPNVLFVLKKITWTVFFANVWIANCYQFSASLQPRSSFSIFFINIPSSFDYLSIICRLSFPCLPKLFQVCFKYFSTSFSGSFKYLLGIYWVSFAVSLKYLSVIYRVSLE